MDQLKLGKFIAEERKRKKYTQRQLADILGISDKTISKWERGNGFPEISLLLPLCNELEISVNELLSGERLSEADYKEKAEENMVSFIKEKEENKIKMQLSLIVGGIAIVSFLTLILVVCMYTDVMSVPVKSVLVGIACLIFMVGFSVVKHGGRTIGYYKCKKCGETFVPSFGSYLIGINASSARVLKCPCCNKRSWCKKVLAKEE